MNALKVIPLLIGILLLSQVPQEAAAQDLKSLSTLVHLQERDVVVTVHYYCGEEEWGRYVFDITVEALPILENVAGFPYPHAYDVKVYPKSEEEVQRFGAQNLQSKGIWINRDVFNVKFMKKWGFADEIIHENAHYWSDDLIFGKPWQKEGFSELYTYLTLMEMGREKDALKTKNEWSQTFSYYIAYNHPLDKFEYQDFGPSTERTDFAYSKSALFCHEIYERYGLEPLQEINRHLYLNGIQANSFTYMRLLEEYTGEDQKELFKKWVFPQTIDLEAWQRAEDMIHELEGTVEESLSRIEEKWGFSRVMDFIEFQMHVGNQIIAAKALMKKYDFEEACTILKGELEEVKKVMPAFDGYCLLYVEAEEYYSSLKLTLGDIPEDRLNAGREYLLSFRYELFSEELEAFYEDMEMLETYHTFYNEWCSSGCTSFSTLGELLSQGTYEEVMMKVDRRVAALKEWGVTEEELRKSDIFTKLGNIISEKSEEDFYRDMERAREEIRNGSLENALVLLVSMREELSRAKTYGIGMSLAIALGAGFLSFFLVKKRRKDL